MNPFKLTLPLPDFTGIEGTIASIGHRTTVFGAAGSGLSWLVSNEGGVLIGIVATLTGLATNFYYSRKRDLREADEHALRMADFRRELTREDLAAAELAEAKLLADANVAGAQVLACAKLPETKLDHAR